MCISTKNDWYKKGFHETKYLSFLIKVDKLLEKYNELGIKSIILSEKTLIVIWYTIKNNWELK